METRKIKWARRKIEQAIEQDGPYSHNICSMALMTVAQACGKEAANRLVEEFDLTAIYGIPQSPDGRLVLKVYWEEPVGPMNGITQRTQLCARHRDEFYTMHPNARGAGEYPVNASCAVEGCHESN